MSSRSGYGTEQNTVSQSFVQELTLFKGGKI